MTNIYIYCLSNERTEDAYKVIARLQEEVREANVEIFPTFVVPFFAAVGETVTPATAISAPQQEAAQYVMECFLNRCVGMEPDKSDEKAHEAWSTRFGKVEAKLKKMFYSRKLLGSRYNDLMDMRMVKITRKDNDGERSPKRRKT